MGGFQETGPNPGDIVLTNPSDIPFYLKGEYLEQLYVMPADFYTIIPEVISSTKAIIKFKPKALQLVHVYGFPARDTYKIIQFCKKNNVNFSNPSNLNSEEEYNSFKSLS